MCAAAARNDGVLITIDARLHLKNLPTTLVEALTQRLQMTNPKWLENQRMGRWNRGTKKILRFYRRAGRNGLVIPRGYTRQLILQLKREGQA